MEKMNIHYKIIELHPDVHSIIVRYYTDIVTEEHLATDKNVGAPRRGDGTPARCLTDYNFNLPVPAPSEEELHKMLQAAAPVEYFKLQEKILDPDIDTSLEHLRLKIGAVNTVEVERNPVIVDTQLPTTNEKVLTDEEIMDLIKKASSGS